ncbi:MAG TPA: hypothetical protein VIW24_30690 [Aldersonia sp.]
MTPSAEEPAGTGPSVPGVFRAAARDLAVLTEGHRDGGAVS